MASRKNEAPGRANDSRSSARRRGQDVEAGRGNARGHANYSSTAPQVFGHGFTPREIERAETTARAAVAFVRSNPAAWSYALATTARFVAAGERVSVQAIAEAIRSGDATGRPVQLNNSWCPVLARLLVLSVPGASLRVECRRSALDVVDVRAIWERGRHD